MYIQMMGASGLKKATQIAILSANYIAQKLNPHYKILYKGQNDLVAHECILDLRIFKRSIGLAFTLQKLCLLSIIHAFWPALFVTSTSDGVKTMCKTKFPPCE